MSEVRPHPSRGRWVIDLVWRGIVLLVLVAAMVGAYYYLHKMDHAPGAQHGTPPGHGGPGGPGGPVPVETVAIAPRTVPLRPEYLGQTEASQTVDIRARVRGFLQERAFEEGQHVKKGQVLFRIDPRSFQAEVEMSKARRASAEASLDRAQQQVKRYQELLTRQSATPMEVEEWQKESRVAAASVQLETANIAQKELDLSYAVIESPIDGVIGRSLKDVGSYVDETSAGVLAVVQKVDPLYVRYSLSEQDLLRWQSLRAAHQVNMPPLDKLELEIKLSDGRPYSRHGRLNFFDVQVDPGTGTSVVRGEIPNPDLEGALRPGQFVRVTLTGVERVNAMLIPQKAVMQSPAGASVYVVNGDNVVERRDVTLGEWSPGGEWIVEKGLAAGDRVITDRLLQVQPGMPVTATAGPAPSGQKEAKSGGPQMNTDGHG